jgi:hypothetical protein
MSVRVTVGSVQPPEEQDNLNQTDRSSAAEIAALRARLEDAEELLRAIRAGEVNALMQPGAESDMVMGRAAAEHL